MRMATVLLLLIALLSPAPLQAQGGASKTELALAKSVGASTMATALVTIQQIGSLADEVVTGERGAKDVILRANAVRNILLYVVRSLDEVAATVQETDRDAFETYSRLLKELGEVSSALVEFAGGKQVAAKTFRDRRAAAWARIVKLAGLDADSAKNLAPGGAELRVPGR